MILKQKCHVNVGTSIGDNQYSHRKIKIYHSFLIRKICSFVNRGHGILHRKQEERTQNVDTYIQKEMYKHIIICRVTCTKNETGKTTQKFRNMTIWSLIFDFCIQWSIFMVYKMIKHRNNPMWNPEYKKTD